MTRYDDILANTRPLDQCLVWAGYIRPDGYGEVSWENRGWLAHRWFYTMLKEPIPKGYTLDHVAANGCQHKHCVLIDHLEPLTTAENMRRWYAAQTHCKRGHEFTPANTYIHPKTGVRNCLTCKRDATARWNARQR